MIPLLIAAAFADEPDFRSYVDQAEFFLRREWYGDAAEQLELAVAHPDGRHDPEAWFLLATTRLRLADVRGAHAAAEQAQTNARTAEQARQADELSTYLSSHFGELLLTGPEGSARRFDLQLSSMLFDAQAQEIGASVRDQARKRDLLPRRFGLPAGSWTVNGEPVEIVAGQTTTLRAPEGGPSALLTAFDSAEIELGIGLAGWLGSDTPRHHPAPSVSAALSWPVGPIEIGFIGDWRPQSWTAIDQDTRVSFAAGGAGLRLGLALPGLDPWRIRPALTWRAVVVPGIELGCNREGSALSCTRDPVSDLVLYDTGYGHAPGAELSVARLDRRRRFDIGFGLKGRIERAMGRLPATGQTRALSSGAVLEYTTDAAAQAWSATGWSVTAAVFVAL